MVVGDPKITFWGILAKTNLLHFLAFFAPPKYANVIGNWFKHILFAKLKRLDLTIMWQRPLHTLQTFTWWHTNEYHILTFSFSVGVFLASKVWSLKTPKWLLGAVGAKHFKNCFPSFRHFWHQNVHICGAKNAPNRTKPVSMWGMPCTNLAFAITYTDHYIVSLSLHASEICHYHLQ